MLAIVLAGALAGADSCNHPVRVIKLAQGEYPASGATLGSGTLEVILRLRIDETGKVVSDDVIESSGYDIFDNEVKRVAEHSTFEPAEAMCSPAASVYVFHAVFRNKGEQGSGQIVPPTFSFPDGWAPVATMTKLPDDMQTVAEYARGGEHVLIAVQHASDALDAGAAATDTLARLRVEPSALKTFPMAICSGFQRGFIATFDYSDGASERTGNLVEAQGTNGRFSLLYTFPKGMPADVAMQRAIEQFCVQGAPGMTSPPGIRGTQ